MHAAVLIVEDDPFIALDLQDAMEDAGYSVLGPVATVKHGLSTIDTHTPDVAILDYNLGTETSAKIAQRLTEIGVPYVFASGQIERVIHDDVPASAGLIQKPFLMEQVVKTVDKIIN